MKWGTTELEELKRMRENLRRMKAGEAVLPPRWDQTLRVLEACEAPAELIAQVRKRWVEEFGEDEAS